MKIDYDDLELGTVIGTGTVGTVYRATLKSTGQLVAVKLLQAEISRDPLVRARFEREMAILEKLRHPNIIHYYGDGSVGQQLFYAMEAIESGTIKETLARFGNLTWQEVATIARQVCSALQYAHNHGIIHRDLKPGNLFVTETGQIKLGDFGIARDTHSADLTNEGLTVGTHAYMAPEQIVGDANITGKADLYSLGCVLFELLTGHKPFPGTNFAVLFEQHLRTPAPPVTRYVSDCPPVLAKTIAQLLEKDPQQRPFNARVVQGAMYELLHPGDAPASHEPKLDAAQDVAAASVVDPGMASLAHKLGPAEPRQVSWKVLALLALCAVVLVALAVVAQS